MSNSKNKAKSRRVGIWVISALAAFSATALLRPSSDFAADSPANGADASAHATDVIALCDKTDSEIDLGHPNSPDAASDSHVGLRGTLRVVVRTSADNSNALLARGCRGLVLPQPKGSAQPFQVAPPVALDATDYALFLDGREIQGLEGTTYDSAAHRFEFQLTRSDASKDLWKRILGSPAHPNKAVKVALGLKQKEKTAQPSIEGAGGSDTFRFQVFAPTWFWIAVIAIVLGAVLVVATALRTTILRDTLLPQLPPNEQPYSLARCQMAFWFVLVFGSFVFLYVMLWDYNTVSSQALALMGISSATALGAVAVDIIKDSPADAANRGLQALGLQTYADVERFEAEIKTREPQVPDARDEAKAARTTADEAQKTSDTVAADPNATQGDKDKAVQTAKQAKDLADAADRDLRALQNEIQDRHNALRTYEAKSAAFRTEGIWKDITTDLNGPTVHRVQVVVWTLALGGVFVVGVYRDLAMPPDFSPTLLALMGLSGVSYVGFKYPEKNN